MKEILKMLGWYLAAEVLTLFIDLTFSFSAHPLVRVLCAVCTLGILLGLTAQGGFSAAKSDKKSHRPPSPARPLSLGAAGAAIPFLWTVLLALSRGGVLPDGYYRWYKLLCAPFLPVSNLFSADVVSSSLPAAGLAVLFLCSLLPVPAAFVSYEMTRKGKSMDHMMRE